MRRHLLFVLAMAPLNAAGDVATAMGSRRQERVPGIAYILGSEADEGEPSPAFRTFDGDVVFAAGRGRLDIGPMSGGPTVVVNGIVIGAPLAVPGDYYLFDSTGFVLVHPATNTFSSFAITSAAYDYRYSRDGWPDWFDRRPTVADTTNGRRSPPLRLTHGADRIFWHLDAGRYTNAFRVVAAGRLAVADAPDGEASVIRWFGPSQALANMMAATGAAPPGILGLTAVAVIRPPSDSAAPVNFFTVHMLWGIKSVEVDLSRLTLPADATETPWPGFEAPPDRPGSSRDQRARWRRPPAG